MQSRGRCHSRADRVYALAQAAKEKPVKKKREPTQKWRESREAQDSSLFAFQLKALRRQKDVDAVTEDELTPEEVASIATKQAEVRQRLEAIAKEEDRRSGGLTVGWWDETLEPCADEKHRNRCTPLPGSNRARARHRA